mgnify:CR=1 FL=1
MALYRAFKAFRPEKSKQALIPALPYDVKQERLSRETHIHFYILTRLKLIYRKALMYTATKYIKKQKKILKILKKHAHLFKMKSLVFIFTGKL